MKNKVFTVIGILTVLSLFFNSCKKGEDDPWISFRSRNNRVIGKWKLEEYTYERNYSASSSTSNNINVKSSNITKDTIITESYSNGILTEGLNVSIYESYVFPGFGANDSTFVIDTIIDYEGKKYVTKYKYEISLEIKKDNTWIANYSKSKYSQRMAFNEYRVRNSDTLSSYNSDTLIEKDFSTQTWTETGYWYWEDSKKKQIIINAGPMKGYLKRLSNKEIIIEETDNSSSYSNHNFNQPFYTFDDENNPYKEEEGVEVSKGHKTINTKKYYKWVAE